MSVEDVEIVRRWREVLVDDDTEAAAPLLAPDVEWVVVSGESLRGIDEVRNYYAGSGLGGPENLDVEFDPGELEDLGDGHVSAVNHQFYRWKETGELAYERRARIEYTIRDGRIASYEAKLLTDCFSRLDPREHRSSVPVARRVAWAPEGGRMTATIWGLSKKGANYGPAPRPDVRCDRCKCMFPPLALGGCRLVRGLIRGSATCDEFRRAVRS